MKQLFLWIVIVAILTSASVCYAESVVEVWRSPIGMFKAPISTSVNPSDGSCWVVD